MALYKIEANIQYLVSVSKDSKPNYTSPINLPPFFIEASTEDDAIDFTNELFTKIRMPYFMERPEYEDEWNYTATLIED